MPVTVPITTSPKIDTFLFNAQPSSMIIDPNNWVLKRTYMGIEENGQPILPDADLKQLLIAGGLCNNAKLIPPNSQSSYWTILGDPTEAALKVVALKARIDLEAEARMTPRLREIPFDSSRKRMSTIHQLPYSRLAYVKGSPKEILSLCSHIRMHNAFYRIDEHIQAQVMVANDKFARNGLRVLAVAFRELPEVITDFRPENIERDLIFLGLLAMMDPPRKEVAQAVEKCHQAGIRIVMITGDYPVTAQSIARQVGLRQLDGVITGSELDEMDDLELQRRIRTANIFARAVPEQKLRIVTVLKKNGEIVAVTGDGANDAPSLKEADVGVAMGVSGTDVAREAKVSTATVSRVLNNNTIVAEETRQRVYAAIEALGYRPHAAARGLANRQTQIIGLLLPEISGDFFPPCLSRH
jgi:magnesium-transporting ATPase (P-type)